MLRGAGIGVPDRPPGLFPYPTPGWAATARAVEPAIAAGLGDQVAWWDALSAGPDAAGENRADDRGTLLPFAVIVARAACGNRPSKRRRRR